jgi:hypothetical protein
LNSVVVVHGLQGHPRNTWVKADITHRKETGSWPKIKKEYIKMDYYWPEDGFQDYNGYRVMVYGYDSNVSKFSKGPANQKSFLDHSRSLLNDLVGIRKGAVSGWSGQIPTWHHS